VHKCKGQTQTSKARATNGKKLVAYWEAKLKRMGLTTNAGRKIGSESITYAHMISSREWVDMTTYTPSYGERNEG
jgi:hypothetical protein